MKRLLIALLLIAPLLLIAQTKKPKHKYTYTKEGFIIKGKDTVGWICSAGKIGTMLANSSNKDYITKWSDGSIEIKGDTIRAINNLIKYHSQQMDGLANSFRNYYH